MKINPLIFRNYDIRGVVDNDLDDNKVEAIGKAYGTFLNKRKIYDIVVGRDCRLSGPSYQKAFVKGVLSTGINIIDLGEVMTQMVYWGQYRFQCNGGAMLTASHNPWNYNGFKLAISFSLTTGPDEVQELRRLVESKEFYHPNKAGRLSKTNRIQFTKEYYYDILKRVKIKRRFKIVFDPHHGTAAAYMPEIFKRLGCQIFPINMKVDGHFPSGTPDPTDAHLMANVAKLVLKHKADIGLAYDGDGDRIGLVDEKGHVLWNDVAVAIFAKEILERFPNSKVIYNTLCSQVVKKVVLANKGIPIMWLTGHAFIKEKIAKENAVFGGELSGHFFFSDNAYGHDDGAYATLRILEYLSEKKVSLSQLYESFPKYISSPEIKIGCPDDKKKVVIKDLSKRFKRDFPKAEITDDSVIRGDDGCRADFSDGMMIFRYSQNGPYITVKFEAKDEKTYEERRQYVSKMLHSYPDMNWKDELAVNVDIVA